MKRKILGITKSYCPICLQIIKASVLAKGNNVFISKTCKNHGKFESLHVWDTLELYENVKRINSIRCDDPNGILIDLTFKCNLECPFCFVYGGEDRNLNEPTISSIVRQTKRLQRKVKFPAIFLFGGEPTLRKDLHYIIRKIKALKLQTYLFTNGLKLEDRKYLKKLKNCGLDHVVLQFDSLDDVNCALIRGKRILSNKLRAIVNLKKEKIHTDLFVVILKAVNENEIGQIISYASKNSEIIKNVYISTLTHEGRYPINFISTTNSERLKLIESQTVLTKRDFFICTEFDHYLSIFIRRLFGSSQRLSRCDLGCYIYSLSSGKYVPLTWIVKLENVIPILKKVINSLDSNKKPNLLNLFKLSRIIFNLKNTTKFYGLFLNLLIHFQFSIFSAFFSSHVRNKIRNLFRVIVTQFQDRYNADFDLFKNCNLWSQVNGKLQPLCVKIIRLTGPSNS